jgi:UDP:flavonoid glycosyltransferase YjiC (YdhE family)
MLARSGAAISLPPGDVTADRVAEAVRHLLDDPSFTTAARAIAEEIAGMPTAEEVAAALQSRLPGASDRAGTTPA